MAGKSVWIACQSGSSGLVQLLTYAGKFPTPTLEMNCHIPIPGLSSKWNPTLSRSWPHNPLYWNSTGFQRYVISVNLVQSRAGEQTITPARPKILAIICPLRSDISIPQIGTQGKNLRMDEYLNTNAPVEICRKCMLGSRDWNPILGVGISPSSLFWCSDLRNTKYKLYGAY